MDGAGKSQAKREIEGQLVAEQQEFYDIPTVSECPGCVEEPCDGEHGIFNCCPMCCIVDARRFTTFKSGDRVQTIADVRDASWGRIAVPAFQTGTLDRLNRVQDGLEIWTMWLDEPRGMKSLLVVTHLQIKKI